MKNKVRPLRDRLLVRPVEAERVTSGGIVIPDTASTDKPMQGEVLAVGPGHPLDSGDIRPVDLKIGDKVLFGKYSGTEIKVDQEDLLVMREEDVMGVIEA